MLAIIEGMMAVGHQLMGRAALPGRRQALSLILLTATLGGLLAACDTAPPPRPRFADITFNEFPPINLDVARIEVVDQYMPPLKAPHVEQYFPVSIAATAERWGRDRLRAVGTSGTARVIIKDASAIATELPRKKGVTGMFTNDQAVRYDGRVEMAVEILDDHGLRRAIVEATAQRSRSVPEDISLNGRDQVFFELTEALMKDINGSLEKNIRSFMARYIR